MWALHIERDKLCVKPKDKSYVLAQTLRKG